MPPLAIRLLLFSLVLLVVGRGPAARAQTPATDSLRRALARTAPDSTRVLTLLQLAYTFRASRPDSMMLLTQQAWELSSKLGFEKGRGRAQGLTGTGLRERGDLPKAYANLLLARQIGQRTHDLEGEALSLNGLGNISMDLHQYQQAIGQYREAEAQFRHLKRMAWVVGSLTNIGNCYEKLNQLDSALVIQRRAEALLARYPRPKLAASLVLRNMGTVQARLGHYPEAFGYYRRALRETYLNNDLRNRSMTEYHLAKLFYTLHQPDSSLRYARQSVRTGQQVGYRLTLEGSGNLLKQIYQARHQPDSALRYQNLASAAHDSLYGPEKFRQMQLLAFREQQRQQRQRAEHELQAARYQRLALLGGLGVILVIALVLGIANYRQRQTNRLLHERNLRIEAQRNELNRALTELRATQTQLVAAEKWAFVGELSAGIAHELQNPLEFMRRFAEVSVGLLGPNGEAQANGVGQEILAGLRKNLHEISQHGQRASAIISEMLTHAHPDTSPPVPTDVNALVAENLRLAYQTTPHANLTPAVELEMEFAPGLPAVPAAPPELGRALLNLFVNALHAVRARQQAGEPGFQPQVCVRTQRAGDSVEIRVRDNGLGMSANVVAQAFQPFFTTKPLGEGTGLGLALAHDIIVKSHRGTLLVDTREGEFTEFTVRLPA